MTMGYKGIVGDCQAGGYHMMFFILLHGAASPGDCYFGLVLKKSYKSH